MGGVGVVVGLKMETTVLNNRKEKRIRYLGINLPLEERDFYTGNYNALETTCC